MIGIYFWLFASNRFSDIEPSGLVIGNKILIVVQPLLTAACGWVFGAAGESYSSETLTHFDKRRYTLFGIKWYHYLWLPVLLYPILLQTAWVLDYGLSWIRLSWLEGANLYSIIPGLFLMGIVTTLMITWEGFRRGYDYLSDYTSKYSASETALGVLKFGIGFPILAMIAQSIILLVHVGLVKLLD
jgi:hypothetical protein